MIVGEVSVVVEGDYIKVTYKITDDEWMISETNLAVETSMKDIPQTASGNPIPADFPNATLHNPFVKEYTYSVASAGRSKVYIAAHAYVVKQIDEDCNTTAAMVEALIPSKRAEISSKITKVTSFYDLELSNAGELAGTYAGWCIDNNHKEADFSSALLVSSYSTKYDLNLFVPDKNNLDLLNYLMNKYYPATSFPVIQASVWRLMNGSFSNPDGGIELTSKQMDQYKTIIADVLAKGEGFIPGPGESFVIIADSGDRSKYQNVFFLFKKCTLVYQNEISWGKGQSFPGNSWAKYFGYCVQ